MARRKKDKIEFYRFYMSGAELDFKKQKDDILCYTLAIYTEYYNGDYGYVGREMGVLWGGTNVPPMNSIEHGRLLLEQHRDELFFQYPRNFFWDFVDNEKTHWDLVLFRAFQALKSIIGDKQYCKTTNAMWMARMCGCRNVEEFESRYIESVKSRKTGKIKRQAKKTGRNSEITKYNSHYYFRKIRADLERVYNGVKFLDLPRESGVHGFYFTTSEDVTREDMARMIVDYNRQKQKTKREEEKERDNEKAAAVLRQMYRKK